MIAGASVVLGLPVARGLFLVFPVQFHLTATMGLNHLRSKSAPSDTVTAGFMSALWIVKPVTGKILILGLDNTVASR